MIARDPGTMYQTIILAGLGREGRSSYRYLSSRFPSVAWILADDAAVGQLDPFWQSLLEENGLAEPPKVRFTPLKDLSSLSRDIDCTQTLLVKTAGIPREHLSIAACLEAGATLASNTALFFSEAADLAVVPKTIGVTGTKGKSTTASLLHHVLKECGLPVLLAGNIGVPPLETLENPLLTASNSAQPAIIVLELSSHQLRELTVSPHIAVIQDITPEHLDYYRSFEDYRDAKAPIAKFQTDQDWVVFNPHNQTPSAMAAASPAQKIRFGLEKAADFDVYLSEDALWYHDQRIIGAYDLPLVGSHNLLNIMPSIAVAMKICGCPADAVAAAIQSFRPLPHRLEFVRSIGGVEYYNDSQATTPEAAIAALASFPGKSIILLAGGSEKGVSFEELGKAIVDHRVQNLILFPPMGEKIAAAVKSAASEATSDGTSKTLPEMRTVTSMAEAVTAASSAAQAQSPAVVLLSPACASFGLFKNYQDRGDQFKQAAQQL